MCLAQKAALDLDEFKPVDDFHIWVWVRGAVQQR
jgi:hypothetical protein